MNVKELKELIEFLIAKDISEFELERGDVKMRMKRGASGAVAISPAAPIFAPPPGPAPAAAAGAPAPAHASTGVGETAGAEEAGMHVVRSPIVGTFYEAGAPGAPPFVQLGDVVQTGQCLCIIEAMKLMSRTPSRWSTGSRYLP
jgi:acetyl-CoA carboxylase biotin carboxyl carrier protein